MLSYLFVGILLGLSAGFSPGPLTALLISETLVHNIKAGIKVGLAPIICDAPIILFTYYIISRVSNINFLLAIISFLGGIYIVYLGIKSMQSTPMEIKSGPQPEKSLQKGIIVNFLNPHPYIFWLTVGSPTFLKAKELNFFAAFAFILGFYLFLVGSKILIATLVGKSRQFFKGKTFVVINKIMGILLLLFALILFKDGIELLLGN